MKNKILIIGSGSIAERHIKNLFYLKENNISVYTKSPEQKKKIKKLFPKVLMVNKIQKKDYTHVILANSSYERFKLYKKYFNQNNQCRIYFEKPLACKLKELTSLNQDKSNFFLAGFQLRAHPLIIKVKEILKKDLIKLKYCNLKVGQNLKLWRKNYDYTKLYYSKSKRYSGVIWELSHEIDIAYYLFGLPKTVFAQNLNLMNFKNINNDYSLINFNYKKFVVNISMDMIYPGLFRKYEFVFNQKVITLDLVKNKILLIQDNSETILYELKKYKKNRMFIELMQTFLKKKKKNFASFNDLSISNRLLNKIEISSKKKKILNFNS